MPIRALAALALIFMMSAAAHAQFVSIQGWVIAPGAKHTDNIEVRITERDGFQTFASTTVSDTGRYLFTNLDLSIGNFDAYILIDGYRESRTPIALPQGIASREGLILGGNIVLIPDADSRRQAEAREAYSASLIDEYAKGLDQIGKVHPELALAHLEKVVAEIPDFYDARMNLGLVYEDLKRYAESEKEFRSAHELNSQSARPLVALARLFVDQVENGRAALSPREVESKLNEARALSTEAIEIDPKYAKAHYYKGAADYRSRSYENSELELKRALELDHSLFEARHTLVLLFVAQKKWQSALDNADTFMLDYPYSRFRAEVAATRTFIVGQLEKR